MGNAVYRAVCNRTQCLISILTELECMKRPTDTA